MAAADAALRLRAHGLAECGLNDGPTPSGDASCGPVLPPERLTSPVALLPLAKQTALALREPPAGARLSGAGTPRPSSTNTTEIESSGAEFSASAAEGQPALQIVYTSAAFVF